MSQLELLGVGRCHRGRDQRQRARVRRSPPCRRPPIGFWARIAAFVPISCSPRPTSLLSSHRTSISFERSQRELLKAREARPPFHSFTPSPPRSLCCRLQRGLRLYSSPSLHRQRQSQRQNGATIRPSTSRLQRACQIRGLGLVIGTTTRSEAATSTVSRSRERLFAETRRTCCDPRYGQNV